jgi:hypothetical protein
MATNKPQSLAMTVLVSRKIITFSSSYPVHITARTVNAEPFPLYMDSLCEFFADYLYFAHFAHKV